MIIGWGGRLTRRQLRGHGMGTPQIMNHKQDGDVVPDLCLCSIVPPRKCVGWSSNPRQMSFQTQMLSSPWHGSAWAFSSRKRQGGSEVLGFQTKP